MGQKARIEAMKRFIWVEGRALGRGMRPGEGVKSEERGCKGQLHTAILKPGSKS